MGENGNGVGSCAGNPGALQSQLGIPATGPIAPKARYCCPTIAKRVGSTSQSKRYAENTDDAETTSTSKAGAWEPRKTWTSPASGAGCCRRRERVQNAGA